MAKKIQPQSGSSRKNAPIRFAAPTYRTSQQPAESESLADRAYRQIRDEILGGRFVIGAILSRRKLAEKFDMSFLPITEALQRLESDGLVESQPRIGTRVRIPSPQDVLDNYIIREALESQAARMCCEEMSQVERKQLLKSARDLDRLYKACVSAQDDPAYLFSVHVYHMKFHMEIAKLSRSTRLLHSIEREQVLIFNWLYDTAAHRTVLPPNFHLSLAKAICSRDPQVADAAMREHVRFGLESVVEIVTPLERGDGWRLKRTG